jgi:6-pyruvoyltetrahydropterin/6-carboxytetrahydropterin synthase
MKPSLSQLLLAAAMLGIPLLNAQELPEYSEINPTSEVMARNIYRRLSESVNTADIKVYSVRIEESANSGCTYFEE